MSDTITLKEACSKTGKSLQTIRAYIKRGYLEGVYTEPNAPIRISISSLEALPSKMQEATKRLHQQRSQNMRDKWQKIKS